MKEDAASPIPFDFRSEKSGGSRVVAVVGADGAGKSKVCAALLELGQPQDARAKAKSAEFADKSRLLEAESAENRRNFSCYNHTYTQCPSEGVKPRLHIIDTPGHVERAGLVDQALRPAHGAVLVMSAKTGLDAETGRSIAALERAGKPAVIFLNGVDRADDAAGFDAAIDALEKRLKLRPVVLFAPVHHVSGEPSGSRLLNVLDGTLCSELDCQIGFDMEQEHEPSKDYTAAWCEKLRDQQIESLAAVDDEMMEAYVEFDGAVPRVLIEAALHRAVAAGLVMPLIAGSAKTGLGVDALQEAIHALIPAGDGRAKLDELGVKPMPPPELSFAAESDFMGWAFGQRATIGGERWLEVRVLGGTLRMGQRLKLAGRLQTEELQFEASRLMVRGPRGEQVDVSAAGPGDLVLMPAPPDVSLEALSGAGCAVTETWRRLVLSGKEEEAAARGDQPVTQCSYALQLDRMSSKEQKRLLDALEVMQHDDVGLSLRNSQTGEHVLFCSGPLHLELVKERLAEEFRVMNLQLGKPQVEYHSTVKSASQAIGKHHHMGRVKIRKGVQHGGGAAGVPDAVIKVELSPSTRDSGVALQGLENVEYKVEVERGLREGLLHAGPGGTPLTDVVVKVLDADAENEEAAHDAAEAAAQRAVEEAASTVLLEPIARLELDVPRGAVDEVSDDLRQHRRAEVWCTMKSEKGFRHIEAEAPIRELLDYATCLQKLTDGKGFYSYRQTSYREVHHPVEQDILLGELHVESEK